MKLIGTTITKRVTLSYNETTLLKSLVSNSGIINKKASDFFYRTNLELKFIMSETVLPHTVLSKVSDTEIIISEVATNSNTVWEITYALTNEPEPFTIEIKSKTKTTKLKE